jgi:hypothetical protein
MTVEVHVVWFIMTRSISPAITMLALSIEISREVALILPSVRYSLSSSVVRHDLDIEKSNKVYLFTLPSLQPSAVSR